MRDRWCVHSYYSLCPWAPDGSGRLLVAGADLGRQIAEVFVLDSDGAVIDRFGKNAPFESFWHTGFWQSWSHDARYVYYQAGTLKAPAAVRRELATGDEVRVEGDLEGIPPSGEPGITGSHGLLYAAGYGNNQCQPELAPVPFQARDHHGIYRISFDPPGNELLVTTQQILEQHPNRAQLEEADRDIRQRLGGDDGLTLMTYCVRWNRQGTRFLFFFGNHSVAGSVPERGEPRIKSIFTADRDFSEVHLANELSFSKGGHWSWHPDGEHIVGYGPDPDDPDKSCMAQVRYDGTGYRKLVDQGSGHPSISPRDHNLAVSDLPTVPGKLNFFDLRTGEIVHQHTVERTFNLDTAAGGSTRKPDRVCLHPVFNHAGDKVLINTMPGRHAAVAEVVVPELDG